MSNGFTALLGRTQTFGKERGLGLTREHLVHDLDALGASRPSVAAAIADIGYPEPRIRPRGYETLLRTIVGQQVSVAAASSIWNRLLAQMGGEANPAALIEADFDTLRACGLSRQKQGYARSLSELVNAGELTLDDLPDDDEDAIALLTKVKGIGRWSAEIYLMFAEGRRDMWPAGDLAVQEGFRRLEGLETRPSEQELRALGADFSPYRSALALLTWHVYANSTL